MKKVNICGIPHTIIECKDDYRDNNCGMIEYIKCIIKLNPDLTEEAKKETLCHEIIHGIFVHLGYNDLAENEQLVQAIGNGVYQTFDIKYIEE